MADFGVAFFVHQWGVMKVEAGSYKWMASEVCFICIPKPLFSFYLQVFVHVKFRFLWHMQSGVCACEIYFLMLVFYFFYLVCDHSGVIGFW